MVVERMQKAGLPLEMIDRIPWQVVAAQEFEQAVQVVNDEGITPVLREKSSSAYLEWDFSGFVLHTRPDWPARFVTLFPTDEARLFPNWITQSAGHPAPAGRPRPFIDVTRPGT
jgi:hypothetical protein